MRGEVGELQGEVALYQSRSISPVHSGPDEDVYSNMKESLKEIEKKLVLSEGRVVQLVREKEESAR